MLARSPKPITIGLLLFLCVFLVWQLGHGSIEEHPSKAAASVSSAAEQRNRPRIAIVTFITDQKSYIHISLKNKDHYARRHRYDFIVDYESHSERGTMWSKFDMIERLINAEKHDWIWWMDFDTLITNTDIKVADIINESLANVTNPDQIDHLLTHDCNGLNAGSFIVRGKSRSIKLFDDVRALYDSKKAEGEQYSEQDSMVHLLKNDKRTAKHALRVPQIKLNAFPEEIRCFDEEQRGWEPGTFVIHFAGAWAHVKGDDPTGQLMRKYQDHIIWGDWKELY
ncbi:glycosyltransferase family 34 protein [Zopfia rhizophila CBS 207.26]|uniref:Glycosyltransferase family 34 protein n=1 Tax=Zopfia rhizophila CBS 207.26 TaxID=1314779 RepID=A0A6A6EAA1_9PEZI|nr:glycosyltransferase family 34 protein [Zopfia rhizophila CBS 207.26]